MSMLIHTVARGRGALTSLLGAWLLVAVAAPPISAQDLQAASSAAPPSQSQSVSIAPVPSGFFSEPHVIAKSVGRVTDRLGDGQVKNGFYPEFSNMITGAGWVAAGPGY